MAKSQATSRQKQLSPPQSPGQPQKIPSQPESSALPPLPLLSASPGPLMQPHPFEYPVIAQSLELVKTAVHVTFASLFFVREILPVECFGHRQHPIFDKKTRFCYEEHFVNGNPPTDEVPWNAIMMERGRHEKADKILNLLEDGIFDALIRRRLLAIQITVFESDKTRSTAFESYTITLGYGRRQGKAGRLSHSVVDSEDRSQNLHDSRAVKYSTMDMQGARTLGFHLFYTPDCPDEYQPAGFHESHGTPILSPGTESSSTATFVCRTIDTGLDSVTLTVRYIDSSLDGNLLAQED
ncbi:DNA-binding HORMA [Penicillium macrosclerotiorum]|uniref:DNA-binding HORMA n=1 Tax=Penicillium macrosclerotiorum TaxID=303699 RepID=UPI002548DA00|nr:DNA-binding HORMA [Penicillium macrosclerotiorum]KAJ5679814.1 DNA-binding HORMA [Penicillium macrosclerotiorum]